TSVDTYAMLSKEQLPKTAGAVWHKG
ncbi:hypothetical protein EVA_21269, partial [gut metagenome]